MTTAANTLTRTGYFAVVKMPIYPVPEDMRQEALATAKGLLFRSMEPSAFLEFYAGIGEWRSLSPSGADDYANVGDKYNSIPVSRPEALLILRRLRSEATLPA